MSKVKIRDFEVHIHESEYDYPIYLNYQDEDCQDEYTKVTENSTISIKSIYGGYIISTSPQNTVSTNFFNNITKKEHFDEFLNHALEYITILSKSDY